MQAQRAKPSTAKEDDAGGGPCVRTRCTSGPKGLSGHGGLRTPCFGEGALTRPGNADAGQEMQELQERPCGAMERRCTKRREPPSYMSYWSYMSYRGVQDCQCRGNADVPSLR